MKADTQIEPENCRRTCLLVLVARNRVIRNLRRIQFAMQEEQLYVQCKQDERTSIYQSYYVSALLFSKKKSQQSKIQHLRKSPTSFQHWRFPSREEIKTPTPVLQPIHFQLQLTKTLILGNLFKLVRFANTFARRLHIFFIFIPKRQTSRANVMSRLKSLNKLRTRFNLTVLNDTFNQISSLYLYFDATGPLIRNITYLNYLRF